MLSADQLIQQNFQNRGGRLIVDGLPLASIASEFGTPLYLYSTDVMDEKLRQIRETFPGAEIHYSVKANPNPSIAAYFVGKGCGLEVASYGELKLALACGCASEEIVFAGPGKTYDELSKSIDSGVFQIHVESRHEVENIRSIIAKTGCQVRVAVRINPSPDFMGGDMVMGGKPTAFGVQEDEVADLIGYIKSCNDIQFNGFHYYTGTQIFDAAALIEMYRHFIELSLALGKETGSEIRVIDFGGGFGVPYFDYDSPLDLETLRRGYTELISRYDGALGNCRMLFEPGRFLVGEAGMYVAKVIDRKRNYGKTFFVLDGGFHHHIVAAGLFGQIVKRNFPIAVDGKLGRDPVDKYMIAGPLCTPLDTMAHNIKLPEPEIGDLVIIFQSGAYGYTASPLHFLSHPAPPEVMVSGGKASLIRERGTDDDVFFKTTFGER